MSERLEYLDSSRGLAALSVVLSHFFGAYGLFPFLVPFNYTTLHTLWHGEGAVTYFYVLSGYVLSIGFFKKKNAEDHFNIIAYLIRRVLRIFPIFVFSVWVSFFLLKYYISCGYINTYPVRTDWVLGLWNRTLSFKEAFQQSLLLVTIPELTPKLLPQGWTLTLEMIGSSILPLALILLKKGKALFVLFFCYAYLSGSWSFFAFAIGIIIAFYSDRLVAFIKPLPFFLIALFLLAGFYLYASPFNLLKGFVEAHPTVRFKIQCIGAAIFLICIIGNDKLKSILSKKFLVFPGKISYGIYVTHFFILIPVIPLLIRWMNMHNISGENSTRFLALSALILMTMLLSWILYKLIEMPFIELSKRIVKNILPVNKINHSAGSN